MASSIVTWILVVAIAVPAYSYVVYPVLLFLLATVVQTRRDIVYLFKRGERRSRRRGLPKVSLILAAYNEAEVIEKKVTNCLELEYPREKLQVIIGSDGSTDGTAGIIGRYAPQGVELLDFQERRGKLAVVSDCVKRASGEILVLTDANTMLDSSAIENLVRHFDDPKVGAVCGELRLNEPGRRKIGESTYWRFEVILKFLESKLDSVLGANGAIYAIRKELFPQAPANWITEDFVIPMKCRAQGYRVRYDPEAIAYETAASSARQEFARRVRIGAGNFQAMWECRSLLLPWRGFVSFEFISHKVLRWLTPFAMVAALAANAFLLGADWARILFTLQVGFYATAGLGYLLLKAKLQLTLMKYPYYFLVINLGLLCGFFRWVTGSQKADWRRTLRSALEG